MKSEGFRGRYDSGLITPSAFFRIPSVLREVIGCDSIVVGHDPRPSSEALYQALIDGACQAGIRVFAAGITPTPMLSKWAIRQNILGLMVTASHNPVLDNGLKLLGCAPLTKSQCSLIEVLLKQDVTLKGFKTSQTAVSDAVKEDYYNQLKHLRIQRKLSCVIDSAHGAWYPHLDILSQLGISIEETELYNPHLINTSGALHTNMHLKSNADYVICFDGDGDRLQLVRQGIVLDGDDMLYHLAKNQRSSVVTTVMANETLIEALAHQNIFVERVDVGDHHVRERLKQLNARVGAEPCGHILDLNWLPTSDPVYSFVYMMQYGDIQPLENKRYQYQMTLPNSHDIHQLKVKLSARRVRTVIRYSQTEPVIRVLLEGEKARVLECIAD